MWTFSPLEEKEYTFEPKLTFWPAQTPGCDNSESDLKVTGVGSKGFIVVGIIVWPHAYGVENYYVDLFWIEFILEYFVFFQAEKSLVDVGEIVVGGYRSVELPLVNQSPCSVSFCLSVKETILDKDLAVEPRIMPNGTFCCSLLNNCAGAITKFYLFIFTLFHIYPADGGITSQKPPVYCDNCVLFFHKLSS